MAKTAPVCGADGCPAGWLAVTLTEGSPGKATVQIVPAAARLLEIGSPVAIDIPIGLTDDATDGRRRADVAARQFLQERNTDELRGVGSRVFGTPHRAHLSAHRSTTDYGAFRARFPPPNSLSKQCWNICGKIAELDDLCGADPDLAIFEAHPEVAFAHHAGRTLHPKKSTSGAAQRRALLQDMGFKVDAMAEALPNGRKYWVMDDLFDACILSVTAQRILEGHAKALPNAAERDSHGIRRFITY